MLNTFVKYSISKVIYLKSQVINRERHREQFYKILITVDRLKSKIFMYLVDI